MYVVVLPIRKEVKIALVIETVTEGFNHDTRAAKTEDPFFTGCVLRFEILKAAVDNGWQAHINTSGGAKFDSFSERHTKCEPSVWIDFNGWWLDEAHSRFIRMGCKIRISIPESPDAPFLRLLEVLCLRYLVTPCPSILNLRAVRGSGNRLGGL